MSALNSRDINTSTPLGKRQLKEVLTSIFAGLIFSPQDIWLVTAWLTDFDVIDNRSGDWNVLNPNWGSRMITFLDLLETAVDAGCQLNLVVKQSDRNDSAVNRLKNYFANNDLFYLCISQELHIKGLLTKSCFLKGSMNFTYFGANKNEELLTLTSDLHSMSSARIDFKKSYKFEYPKATQSQKSERISEELLQEIDEEEDDHDFF